MTVILDDDFDSSVEEDFDGSSFAKQVIVTPMSEYVHDNFLEYSLYTAFSRVVTSEDGLIPVWRRIVYMMMRKNAIPVRDFVKAGEIAGEVMGKIHPHSDQSIAGSLAQLAQTFKTRVPLVDYFGSVGENTGDKEASARYWEAKMTPAAVEMVADIKEGGLLEEDMPVNFAGIPDPKVLPSRFPANLINGTYGTMGVGFSPALLPHNPREVMLALRALLANPDLTVDELLEIMPAPDFPKGGVVTGIDGVRDYYTTGKGSVVLRGRYKLNHLDRGRVEFLFYELPFSVSASKIVKTIHAKKADDKSKLFADVESVNDFSDKKRGLQLSIVTKPGSDYNAVLAELFSKTDLQKTQHARMYTIIDGIVGMRSMFDVMNGFLDMRYRVNVNKSRFAIENLSTKLHAVRGLLAVLVDIDTAIAIIRESEDASVAKNGLMERFGLDEGQASNILAMPLRKITKSDSIAVSREAEELEAEIDVHRLRLSDRSVMNAHIDSELEATMNIIGDDRRTEIVALTTDDLKAEEKALKNRLREAKRDTACTIFELADGSVMKVVDGDMPVLPFVQCFDTKTNSEIFAIDEFGVAHRIPVSFIASDVAVRRDSLVASGSSIVGFANVKPVSSKSALLLVTDTGSVKLCKTDYPNGAEFSVFKLRDDERVVCAFEVNDANDAVVVLTSSDSSTVLFELGSMNTTSVKAGGVAGIKLREGHRLVSANVVSKGDMGRLMVLTSTGSSVKVSSLSEFEVKSRGGVGVRSHAFRAGESELLEMVITDTPYMTVSSDGSDSVVPLMLPAPAKRDATGMKPGVAFMVGSKAPTKATSDAIVDETAS